MDALENGLDRLDCSDDELLSASFLLENFLFQANAFLDFYMLYLCLLLGTEHTGKMASKDQFYKVLDKVKKAEFKQKAVLIRSYFDKSVFGIHEEGLIDRNDWGALLRELRDKVAHRDKLRPSFDSQETLIGEVLFNWPTLQNTTYDRFCQNMQNGMFFLIHDVSPIIYELEWKPGPYQSGMWDEES